MPVSEIIQLALIASKFARDLLGGIPADQLTPEQLEELRKATGDLNAAWAALAPVDDADVG